MVPKGCKKQQKVVIRQNPKPNLMDHDKTAQTRVQEKPLKTRLFGKTVKTVKKCTFCTFHCPGSFDISDRKTVGILAKMAKMQ